MKEKVKLALKLFAVFFKIGAFTFGGGYAMLPIIKREVAEKNRYITEDDILDIVSIAESTPGPIAINCATFVGYKICGVFGAFCATLGVVLPPFAVITVISAVLKEFSQIPAVRYAFSGIRAGVLALIINALFSMYKKCPKEWFSYLIMAAAFVLSAFLKLNAVYIVLGCAVFGICASLIANRRSGK